MPLQLFNTVRYPRRHLLAIVILVAGLLAYISLRFGSLGTDGVFYAGMGRSLAEGHGLTVYGVPHTIYSPLLPMLIAPFYLLGVPLDVAIHLPIMALALATILGVYMLGRDIDSERAGLLSAILLASSGIFLWSSAVSSSPQIISGFFALLATLALVQITTHGARGVFLRMVGAGIFVGLAYLARPEYFFLIAPIAFWSFCVLWRKFGSPVAFRQVATLLLAFFLCILPYLYYLYDTLGYVTISGRGNELAYIVSTENYERVDETAGAGVSTVVAPPKLEVSAFRTALADIPGLLKRLLDGLLSTEQTLARIFGIIGISFWGYGIRHFVMERKWGILTLHLVFLTPVVLVAFAQGGSSNYLVQFFYLFMPTIAVGVVKFAGDLREKFSLGERGGGFAVGICGFACALYFFIPVPQNILFLPKDYRDAELKEMGLWMEKNIPDIARTTVVSRKPEPTFYAGSLWAVVPNATSSEHLARIMRERGQTYVIIDDRNVPATRPELVGMLDPARVKTPFELVHQTEHHKKRAYLYRLSHQ